MWKTEGTVNGGKEGGESRSGARGKEGKIIPRNFHNVENAINNPTTNPSFRKITLAQAHKICYNRSMKEIGADCARLLSLIGGEYGEKFAAFRELLLACNEKFNLTSVVEEREILYKHFLDSAMGERFFPVNSTVAEVGSGAGFPSVPLKILRGDLSFTLFESVGKKCEFLETAVKELGLSGMSVQKLRAEDAARGEFREKFDVCCARAVARMNTLAEYCLPLVRTGGRMIAYKGNAEAELAEAERAIALLGGEVEECAIFSLPEGCGERTIVVIRKKRPTPAKYPRGRGKERSAPLI